MSDKLNSYGYGEETMKLLNGYFNFEVNDIDKINAIAVAEMNGGDRVISTLGTLMLAALVLVCTFGMILYTRTQKNRKYILWYDEDILLFLRINSSIFSGKTIDESESFVINKEMILEMTVDKKSKKTTLRIKDAEDDFNFYLMDKDHYGVDQRLHQKRALQFLEDFSLTEITEE
ncbi:hypothetical protein [Fusobacterium sp. PH5-44]|uniref:hypothetical protein n=1 Tax=unclassified Fusobacterium TaxID=2648384 RepID=UPI003D212BDF